MWTSVNRAILRVRTAARVSIAMERSCASVWMVGLVRRVTSTSTTASVILASMAELVSIELDLTSADVQRIRQVRRRIYSTLINPLCGPAYPKCNPDDPVQGGGCWVHPPKWMPLSYKNLNFYENTTNFVAKPFPWNLKLPFSPIFFWLCLPASIGALLSIMSFYYCADDADPDQ